jgi:hypothetical protein
LALLELKTQITSYTGFIDAMLAHGFDWWLTIRTFQSGAFASSPVASVPVTVLLPTEILTEFPIFIDGDFNGDGHPDLLARRSDTHWNIFLSTDDGRWFDPQPALTFEVPGRGNLEIKDLTGAGRSDVIWRDLDGSRLAIFWSPNLLRKDKTP